MMNFQRHGYVIKVRNLDRCRGFYRDILQLGSPLTDSNFRTEFGLCREGRLILCQAREEETFFPGSHSAVFLAPPNPDDIAAGLEAAGYLPQGDDLSLLYPGVRCYHDPEDNLIYLVM